METPSNVIQRAIVADSEVGGYQFCKAERVMVVYHNIMRQAKHFPDAGRFDIERTIDARFRRLLFGAGPHACLGTGLALAKARTVLQALVSLDGDFEICAPHYNRGKTYQGYASLMIQLGESSLRSAAAK